MYPYIPGTYITDSDIDIATYDVNIPNIASAVSKGSGTASRPQIEFNDYSFPAYDYSIPSEEEEMGEFRKGINRSYEGLQASLYGAAGLAGDLLGIDALKDWGFEGYQRNMEEAAKYAGKAESLSDINSLSSFADWAAGTAGSIVPDVISALIPAGIAGTLGKTVAANSIRKYAANAIKDRAEEIIKNSAKSEITKELQDEAISQATKEVTNRIIGKIGAGAMAAQTSIQESGSNWGQDAYSHGVEGTSPKQDLLFGTISGISEAILGAESSLWKAVTGKTVSDSVERTFRRELVKGLPKAMAAEAGQEAFQQILSNVNANIQDAKGLITTEDIQDIIDAAAAGALGGGMFHMPTLYKSRKNRVKLDQDTQNIQDIAERAQEVKQNEDSEQVVELTEDMILGAKSNDAMDQVFRLQQAHDTAWAEEEDKVLNRKINGHTVQEWLSIADTRAVRTPEEQKSIDTATKIWKDFNDNRLRATYQLNKEISSLTRKGAIRTPYDEREDTTGILPRNEQEFINTTPGVTGYQPENVQAYRNLQENLSANAAYWQERRQKLQDQITTDRAKLDNPIRLNPAERTKIENRIKKAETDLNFINERESIERQQVMNSSSVFSSEGRQRNSNYKSNRENSYLNSRRYNRTNREWIALGNSVNVLPQFERNQVEAAKRGLKALRNELNSYESGSIRDPFAEQNELNEAYAQTNIDPFSPGIKNPLNDSGKNDILIPKDEQAFLNAQEARTKEWQEAHPVDTALEKDRKYYSEWDTYAKNERAKLEDTLNKRQKEILDEFAMWQGTDDRQLSVDQRKRKDKVIAEWADFQKQKKKALEDLDKKLAKGYKANDGKLITAMQKQADEAYQREQIDKALGEGAYSSIADSLSGIVTYASKLQTVLDNRIRTIDDAIKSTQGRLDDAQRSLNLTKVQYDRYMKHIKDLQKERLNAIKAKRKISKLLGTINQKMKSFSTENMKDVAMDMQEIIHTGDSILDLERNSDIFRRESWLSFDVARDNFDRLKSELTRLNSRISNLDDSRFGTFKNLAKRFIGNTKAAFDSVNFERDYPVSDTPGDAVSARNRRLFLERKLYGKTYEDWLKLIPRMNELDEYERNLVRRIKEQWDNLSGSVGNGQLTNPSQQAAQNQRMAVEDQQNRSVIARSAAIAKSETSNQIANSIEQQLVDMQNQNIKTSTGQLNTKIPANVSVEPTTAQVPSTNSDIKAAATNEIAASKEQEDHRVLATSVLSQRDSANKDIVSQTIRNISNALESLPGLKDNVVVCLDGNDSVLPVEVQNALKNVSGSPKGVYWNGKVYLFASNITDKADAVRTLVHEGVAHFGLRSIMNAQQLGKFLSLVFDSFSGTQTWKEFMERRPEYFNNTDRITQAEEFVAYVAEQMKVARLLRPDTKSIFTRVISFLRGILSKLGFGDKLTIEDIRDVITISAKNLEYKRNMVEPALREIVVTDDFGIQSYSLPNDPIFGVKFPMADSTKGYYKNLEGSRSGIPNTPYLLNYPKNSNTLNLNDSINEQPQPVQARLGKLMERLGIKPEIQQTENGITVSFFGKNLGSFNSIEEAQAATKNKNLLSNINGWDIYNHLAEQTGDKRETSKILRQFGIRGAQYANDGLNNYYLFEGNDFGSLPFKYDLSNLSEPKFLVDQTTKVDDITIDPETGTYTTKDTEDQKTYLNTLFSNTNSQTRLYRLLKQVKETGKSTDANGNLIEHSWTEKFIEATQDQYRRLKIVQDYLKNKYPRAVDFMTNIYQNLQTMTGEIKNKQLAAVNKYFYPAVDILKNIDADIHVYDKDGNIIHTFKKGDAKYDEAKMSALDDFLMARHAAERNASVSARMRGRMYTDKDGRVRHYNAKTPEKGGNIFAASGLTDAFAAKQVERYSSIPGFQEIAAIVDRMNRSTLDMMLANKLIDQDAYNKMAEYKYYVPLRGWEDMIDRYAPGTYARRGPSLSTGSKRVDRQAKGRTSLPESPFLRSVQQMEDIIAVSHKNNLMKGLGELVRRTSNEKDLWELDRKNPDAVRIQVMPDGNLGFVTKPTELSGSGDPAVTYIDDNGNVQRIVIKDPWLAKALRGENRPVTGTVVEFMRKYTGYLSRLYTSLNPAFFFVNPIRDLPTAILNLGSVIEENQKRGLMEKSEQIQKDILKDVLSGKYISILKDISKYDNRMQDFDPSKYDAQMVQDIIDWRENGGHTRSLDLYSVQDLAKQLRKELRQKGPVQSTIKKAFDYIDMCSDVSENMTRFAVYRNIQRAFEANIRERAKAEGWDQSRINLEIQQAKQKSANIALDCTVNFTKKGAWANAYNPIWAFSSATIQSFARIARNLWRPTSTPQQNFKRVSKFLAFGMGFPLMWGTIARSIMGDDDDGINKYDKIPNYVKLSNFIIPMPFGDGGYIKIPLPYGYNVFTSIGTVIDNIIHGTQGPASGAKDILKTSLSGIMPIDPSSGFIGFLPTILKPLGELAANENFAGAPIIPEGRTVDGLPDYLKSWTKTPQFYKDAAALLNFLSGGFMDKDGVGLLDISPETIEHLNNSYLGGIGRTITQTIELAMSPAFNYDVPAKSIPILNRLYGTVGYDNTNAIYNEFNNQINAAKTLEKYAKDSGQDIKEVRQNYANVLSLEKIQNSTTSALNQIREAENKLRRKYPRGTRSEAYNNQMKLLEKRKEKIMERFNKRAEAAGLEMY